MQINFDLECDSCGSPLDADIEYDAEFRRFGFTIKVKPCSLCERSAYNEGKSDGYQEAKDEWISQED